MADNPGKMREERGKLPGGWVVKDYVELWGSVGGNTSVVKGGKLYIRGNIYGNLTVEDGGRVHLFGNVQGDLIVNAGAKVIHSGVVGGNLINNGGRVYVDLIGKTMGKVKARKGETRFQRPESMELDQ